MRKTLSVTRAIPGLVAAFLAAGCSSTTTTESPIPPAGTPQPPAAKTTAAASAAIEQIGSTSIKGCHGSAIFDLRASQMIDFVGVQGTGLRNVQTDLYVVDGSGVERKLSRQASSISGSWEDALAELEGDTSAESSGTATTAPSGAQAAGDERQASAAAALQTGTSTMPAMPTIDTTKTAADLAAEAQKMVEGLAATGKSALAAGPASPSSVNLGMPSTAGTSQPSSGTQSGSGSSDPFAALQSGSGIQSQTTDIAAANQKATDAAVAASKDAVDAANKQAQTDMTTVQDAINQAMQGKGLGSIDASSQPNGGSQGSTPGAGNPSSSGNPASSSGGSPTAGNGGEPASGGAPSAGGEPASGGTPATGGVPGEGSGSEHLGGSTKGLDQPVATLSRSDLGEASSVRARPEGTLPIDQARKGVGQLATTRMYTGLADLASEHLRVHVQFDATAQHPKLSLVEGASSKAVLASRDFSSAFPAMCVAAPKATR
jgi:hypothetical protein